MEKLMDIYGYNIINDEIDYESFWKGKFLLQTDGTFEGISSSDSALRNRYITGTISNNNIEIYSLTENDNEVCKKYNCTKKDSVFEGTYCANCAKDEFISVPTGECTLRIMPAEKTREVRLEEILGLYRKIYELKLKFGEEGKRIYNQLLIEPSVVKEKTK